MTYYELYELIENTLAKVTSTDVAWDIKYSDHYVDATTLEVNLLVGDELIQETYVDADWDEVAEKLKPLLEQALVQPNTEFIGRARLLHKTIVSMVENSVEVDPELISWRNYQNRWQ